MTTSFDLSPPPLEPRPRHLVAVAALADLTVEPVAAPAPFDLSEAVTRLSPRLLRYGARRLGGGHEGEGGGPVAHLRAHGSIDTRYEHGIIQARNCGYKYIRLQIPVLDQGRGEQAALRD